MPVPISLVLGVNSATRFTLWSSVKVYSASVDTTARPSRQARKAALPMGVARAVVGAVRVAMPRVGSALLTVAVNSVASLSVM